MRPDPREEGRRWVDQAHRDLDDARFARDGGRHNLACFLAQQAAEKALKGFLYLREEELARGHSVADLCDRAAKHDPAFAELRTRAGGLDLYYIPTRYPNGLPGGLPAEAFDREQADRAIERAEEVLDLVEAAFGTTG
ncbi:MAG TPA: HEPN domain-containing protein [Actinomycetota bacterium]|nr:HEPN domain-containing protein [Actinomycetota bacterium]